MVYPLPRTGWEAQFQVSFVHLGEEWTNRMNFVWVSFVRWSQPSEGNSTGWDNLGYVWKSADGLATLYVPIHAIVGAEPISVDVGITSAAILLVQAYPGAR